MPLKILIFALAAFFTILPVSKSIAATGFVTDDTALWTTTDTSTSTSATTSSLTTDSISMDASTSSSSQATSTPSYQSARHGYDALDRLLWTQYEDGTVISYVYDKVGNRTAKNTDAGTLTGFTITATTSGYGSIIPSGTITIASGNGQTFFIEQGIPPNGTGCPSGYAFIAANNRCEETPPECLSGYTFNSSTHQCEQIVITSYQASCDAGQGIVNAATGMCEYAATSTTTSSVNYSSAFRSVTITNSNPPYQPFMTTQPLWPRYPDGCGVFIPGGTVPIVGYSSPAPFSGSIPIYKTTDVLGSCYYIKTLASNTTNLSGGIAGYISSVAQTGFVPVYNCGSSSQFSCTAGFGESGSPIGYMSPTSQTTTGPTVYSCPNGGTLSDSICQNTPICPSGGTLSGSTCYISTTNVATPACSYGTLDSPADRCYYYLPGTLAGFIVDDVAVSLGTLPSMQGPTGRRYYYTFANVAANHAITANFTDASSPPCIDYPARLAGATPANFLSLQSAYNAAASSDTIQGNMYGHFESLLLDRNISVTLDGGYACDFSTISGNLMIKGAMTIANGSVVVNGNIILAAP